MRIFYYNFFLIFFFLSPNDASVMCVFYIILMQFFAYFDQI